MVCPHNGLDSRSTLTADAVCLESACSCSVCNGFLLLPKDALVGLSDCKLPLGAGNGKRKVRLKEVDRFCFEINPFNIYFKCCPDFFFLQRCSIQLLLVISVRVGGRSRKPTFYIKQSKLIILE